MIIRLATEADAGQLLRIYTPYVLHTAITFEYEPPSEEEFRSRIAHTLSSYPYLAAEQDGRICGYAYASAFKSRAAYNWSVETSIYVEEESRGERVGKNLYQALEECLSAQNVCNLCACIAYPNPTSISFHEAFGYKTIAHFHSSGYKSGKWYDMIWMEKMIGAHTSAPEPVYPIGQIDWAKLL